ncbi:MAG: phasin family protein [Novosphingobium sp.]|nr:phasin family protein [Novosphingobium sp.]
MADTPITDAAEKAYAQASEKAVSAAVAPVAAAEAVVRAASPVAAAVVKSAAKPVAVKRAAKPVKAKAKPAAMPKAAKPVAAAKAKPVRKAVVKVAKPVAKPVPTKINLVSKLKDTTMATTAKKTAEDFSSKIQDAMKDAQDRAKTAFEKSQTALGDVNEFSKGNLEALVETGKVLASGMQTMGKNYVAEVKSAIETMQADAKDLTSVKSPKDFVELQSKLLRKYFDNAVAYNSKSAEAALKLANEAFQPISSRVSLAVEKVRKAA